MISNDLQDLIKFEQKLQDAYESISQVIYNIFYIGLQIIEKKRTWISY